MEIRKVPNGLIKELCERGGVDVNTVTKIVIDPQFVTYSTIVPIEYTDESLVRLKVVAQICQCGKD